MSESNNRESIIDAAIESYPLAPLPPGFVDRVMVQIKQRPLAIELPPFRLQFLDVALPAFLALFVAVVVMVGTWAMGGLDAPGLPEAQWSLSSIGETPYWFSLVAVAILGEVILAVTVGVRLWIDGPFLPVNQS